MCRMNESFIQIMPSPIENSCPCLRKFQHAFRCIDDGVRGQGGSRYMFILPFEVLIDEEVMVGGSGGRSTHVRVWSNGL